MSTSGRYFLIIFILTLVSYIKTMPLRESHDEESSNLEMWRNVLTSPVDYHGMVGHVRDFFTYLPVMLTSIRETVTGLPKVAEGIKILSRQSELLNEDENEDEDDIDRVCKCKAAETVQQTTNSIEKRENPYT